MRLLFIADIVGKPGRQAVRTLLPCLREERRVDMVIANGENAAGGSGITPATAKEVFNAGVDVMTCGDHLWDQKEVAHLLQNEPRFLRPLNHSEGMPGSGFDVFELNGLPPVGVLNLQGRTFMSPMENPFPMALHAVDELHEKARVVFVDFHAETTSEKIAMGRMLDGEVSALIGTHTHVQTADEQIFPGGTAFLCDAGFTGPHESILGREIGPIVKRFFSCKPQRFYVAKERVKLQGALVEVDDTTGRAKRIERVSMDLPNEA